ncbi:hypothetical protein SDC9_208349 [bioreactor metagenome]|uniref:Uncharacterized protein n=1 Tax=bioreactor metagenome TaxID=1076179 RepID=A0A645JC26_9ZZZZ
MREQRDGCRHQLCGTAQVNSIRVPVHRSGQHRFVENNVHWTNDGNTVGCVGGHNGTHNRHGLIQQQISEVDDVFVGKHGATGLDQAIHR